MKKSQEIQKAIQSFIDNYTVASLSLRIFNKVCNTKLTNDVFYKELLKYSKANDYNLLTVSQKDLKGKYFTSYFLTNMTGSYGFTTYHKVDDNGKKMLHSNLTNSIILNNEELSVKVKYYEGLIKDICKTRLENPKRERIESENFNSITVLRLPKIILHKLLK